MPEQQEEQEQEEEMNPSENYCDFSIFIKDNFGQKGLIVEATTMDTEIAFNNVVIADDMQKAMTVNRFERSLSEYNGPDFTTLDERIQTSMTEYLEGYGINEQLAAFVEVMSLDKDQRLYMRWLSSLQSFVSN
jgi:complement component 1 Q subcomponent-binding protein